MDLQRNSSLSIAVPLQGSLSRESYPVPRAPLRVLDEARSPSVAAGAEEGWGRALNRT